MGSSANPARAVLERIATAHPAPAVFIGYEVEGWADGAIEALVECGLLTPAGLGASAVCTGCEAQCHKPVVMHPLSDGLNAFIVCDEVADLGRISIPRAHIAQFQGSLSTAVRFVAASLRLQVDGSIQGADGCELGQMRGRNGPRGLRLLVSERQIALSVGQQSEHLFDLVLRSEHGLVVDRHKVQLMADRKTKRAVGSATALGPSDTRKSQLIARDREIRRRGIELRAEGMSTAEAARRIAAMEFIKHPKGKMKSITAERVRRILHGPRSA